MNLQAIRSKKSLKLITLLLTSLLIVSASAATYRYMYIDGTVTVGTAKLIWITGDDAPAGTSIQGSSVSINLPVEPGTPQNFTDCLYLKNQDSAGHTLNLSIATTLPAANFTEAKIHVYQNSSITWEIVDTLDMTIADTSLNHLLGAGEYYTLIFEVSATTSTIGPFDFDVEVEYV